MMTAKNNDFRSFRSLMKSSGLEFAKKMIAKSHPRLAELGFDVRQVGQPCPACVDEIPIPFGRTFSNYIPTYQVRVHGSENWRSVPGEPILHCKQCQEAEIGNRAVEAHKRALIRRATSKYWRINTELEAANLSNYKTADPITLEALAVSKQFLQDWESGNRYSLIFRGTYGAGKSHLLKSIAEIIKNDLKNEKKEPFRVGFIAMEEVLSMIKGTFGTNDPNHNEHSIIQGLIDLDFLVLDDVGSEGGEWAGKKLFEIINGRMGKPTGITTNFTDWDEFANRFTENGGKIVSRLRSKAKVFDIETTDKRIQEL